VLKRRFKSAAAFPQILACPRSRTIDGWVISYGYSLFLGMGVFFAYPPDVAERITFVRGVAQNDSHPYQRFLEGIGNEDSGTMRLARGNA